MIMTLGTKTLVWEKSMVNIREKPHQERWCQTASRILALSIPSYLESLLLYRRDSYIFTNFGNNITHALLNRMCSSFSELQRKGQFDYSGRKG